MIFILCTIISIFIYIETSNFKLSILILNFGITWSILKLILKSDEEEYVEEEIAEGIRKEVDSTFSKLNSKVKYLEERLNKSVQERSNLEQKIFKIENQKQDLENQLNSTKQFNYKREVILKNEINQLNIRINNMKDTNYLVTNKTDINKLKLDLENRERKLNRLKNESIDKSNLVKQVNELNNQIEALNKQVHSKNEAIVQIRNEKIRLEKESKQTNLRDKLRTVNSKGLGRNLESKFRHVLSTFTTDKSHCNTTSYMDVVGVKEYDNYQGTDFILIYNGEEIRIDISARDDKGKDNMYILKQYKLFNLYFRTGNSVKKFNEDVLVYVVPYFNEEMIIKAMIEIYENLEETLICFKNRNIRR